MIRKNTTGKVAIEAKRAELFSKGRGGHSCYRIRDQIHTCSSTNMISKTMMGEEHGV